MRMGVRDATAGDAPQIARVHWQSWHETYRDVFPPAFFDDFPLERREALWRRVADGFAGGDVTQRLLVADDDGSIGGFASFGPFRVPQGATAPAGEGELHAIYVLARAQRRGVGRALFDTGARWLRDARGCHTMALWVIDGNPAEAFYRRRGGVAVEDKTFDAHGRMLVERCYRFALEPT